MRLGLLDGAARPVLDAGSPGAGVEVCDLPALVVVLEKDDAVTGSVLRSSGGDSHAQLARGAASGADLLVELPGLLLAVGDDELRGFGTVPAVFDVARDERGAGTPPRLVPVEPVGGLVGIEGRGDPAGGQVLGSRALPGLGLAPDGLQPGARVAVQKSAVGVARADGLQLVRIAQEDHLSLGMVDLLKDPAELAGVDHPRLVHDEDPAVVY